MGIALLTLGWQDAPRFADARDVDEALSKPSEHVRVLVFVASDCPMSNSYAPEIQRICRDYSARGVRCTLIYEEPALTVAAARSHLEAYNYREVPAIIDTAGRIARNASATVTPEAVVVDRQGATRYRGRIDNFYAALGKPRRQATSHELRDALDAVLAGKRVAVPYAKALGCYITPTGGDK